MHAMEKLPAGGAVVVFAKCPTPGASKTRLASLLGDDGAASLAQAMLMDILEKLSECVSLRLFYAVMNISCPKAGVKCIFSTGRAEVYV